MREIDAFFDELNPDIKVIWGLSDDDSLDEDAERRIAEYEKKHGKPMNRTMQAALMLRGLIEIYDKSLLL